MKFKSLMIAILSITIALFVSACGQENNDFNLSMSYSDKSFAISDDADIATAFGLEKVGNGSDPELENIYNDNNGLFVMVNPTSEEKPHVLKLNGDNISFISCSNYVKEKNFKLNLDGQDILYKSDFESISSGYETEIVEDGFGIEVRKGDSNKVLTLFFDEMDDNRLNTFELEIDGTKK